MSTSIDSGDPTSLYGNELSPDGGRINLGAYGNTSEAAVAATQYIRLDYPNYYIDWPADVGRAILWHSYDSGTTTISGNVDIDLWEVGGSKLADIAEVPAADGSYAWSPQASGVTPDTTTRYEIRIASVDYSALADVSREGFSVPEAGALYFVNDASLTNDQYTTAVGNNRNTGKTAGDPKANLLPVLRSYDLGPADEVRIDTGDYIHVRNVIISGNPDLGDDEGATFTGPSDSGKTAVIDRANPHAGSTNIELNDGDYVTLQHLTLTGAYTGLWVHNGSTNFDGQHLIVSNNTQNGIVIETDAEASTVDYLTAFDNGGTGISISTPVDSVSNSSAFQNGQYGIYLSGVVDAMLENNHVYSNNTGIYVNANGATRLEDNDVYDNNTGIYVRNSSSGAQAVLGNADLSLDRGNRVYNNLATGIYAYGNVLVSGNHIYGQIGSGDVGLYLYSARATQNIVQGNYRGIVTDYYGTSTLEYNRVYDNTAEGILASGYDTLRGNVVYSNSVGLQVNSRAQMLVNNLVYGNTTHGIWLYGNNGVQLVNNTVYQEFGDAVRVTNGSRNVNLRNNVFWVTTGYDIYVSADSQAGFASDFNDLYTTGSGQVAFWQGNPRPSLLQWQNSGFTDGYSLAQDPDFVNPLGPDGQLGYVSATQDGRDDDFHVKSNATDGSDPGSYHGGALAPVLDASGHLPEPLTGTWTVDASHSPCIDRGYDLDSFANEPAPDGGYINLGAYGNTVQASTSPSEYVLVTKPDGGEVWPAEQSFPVRWRTSLMDSTTADTNYSAAVLADSPIAFWRLDESTGATHGC